MRERKELKPEDVTAIIDTREGLPLDLAPLKTVHGTLTTSDYSILGLEHEIAIERKSKADFICCIGQHRERFEREIQRLLAYPVRAIVVECSWQDLLDGEWRGQITPAQATGAALAWMGQGIPILFVGNHDAAGKAVSRLLFIAARRRWRSMQAFSEGIMVPKTVVAS